MSGMPRMTSTSAERVFALGRDHNTGTRIRLALALSLAWLTRLCTAFMRGREHGEEELNGRTCAKLRVKDTMQAKRSKAGLRLKAESKANLDEKRAKLAA
eukprot:6214364-Pleurochrysis_carterae.AAC.7